MHYARLRARTLQKGFFLTQILQKKNVAFQPIDTRKLTRKKISVLHEFFNIFLVILLTIGAKCCKLIIA